jgi:hypothetical protein
MKFTCYYVVANPGDRRIRFSSVFQNEAVNFAQDVWKNEGIIVEIHEVAR